MVSCFKQGVLTLLAILLAQTEGNSLSRIVGGENVPIADFPWQASLRSGSSHICGASFISERWLITASHCVDGQSPGSLTIGYGDADVTRHQSATIARIVMHPEYTANGNLGYPNDIALIELSASVTFGSNVQKIQLASDVGELTNCWITGWGCYRKDFGIICQQQNGLLGVMINVIDQATCKNMWSDAQIQDVHVCLYESGKSACNGDSGGPLACLQNGNIVLAGATSWGASTCSGTLPSVYARVSQFLSWIEATSGVTL